MNKMNVESMETPQLKNYLNKYKVEKGQPYTNTYMGNPSHSLFVPEEEYNDFLSVYSECVKRGIALHYTEKPTEVSPLRVDLDFRFQNNGNTDTVTRKYTDDQIKNIVHEYFKIVNKHYIVELENSIAYTHEKDEPSSFRNKIKDGVHIIFPHILLPYAHQHFIREEMLKSSVFEGMGLTNEIDEVIDDAIIDRNCWLLYGSKKVESHVYKVTHTYSYMDDNLHELPVCDDDYVSLFSMRNKPSDINIIVRDDAKQVIDEFIEEYIKSKTKKQGTTTNNSTGALDFLGNKVQMSDEDKDFVSNLMKCLSYSRANNYNDWMHLGWALHNIDDSLLSTWIEFSKHGDTYKSGECEALWYKMQNKVMGMPSLRFWAKMDNPELYKHFVEQSVITYIDKAIGSDGAHYDVAEVIAKYKKDEIVYDYSAKAFFVVDEKNMWYEGKQNAFLDAWCGTEICRLFMKRSIHYATQQPTDPAYKLLNEERSKKAQKLAQQLKGKYVDGLPQKLIEMCKVKDFVANKLDTNINLLAFENGVYDLDKGEFRKIEATDYISITTGYDYNDKVDKEIVKEVRHLLKSLFLTDEMHDYVLNVLSSVLYGQNKFQEFYIFTGIGANGKSILQKLMAKSLGHYAKKVNTTTFTKANAKQNETSELHNAKGIRNVYCEEPKDTDKFISSRLKEYSGDNRVCTRGLYKDPIEWDIQFTMIFACNNIPELDGCDDDSRAMGRRLRIIDFPMSFIEDPSNPRPDQRHLPNKRKMDVNLGKRIDNDIRYRQAFIKILVENWAKMKHLEALNTPQEVMVASKKYLEESDPVLMFINNYYIYNTDAVKDKKIKSGAIYTHFLNATGILKKDFSQTRFGRKLTALGIKPDDRNENRLNIMKKPDDEQEEQ